MKKIAAALLCTSALVVSPAFAAGKGNGNVQPYSLSVTALTDVQNNTDVTVTATAIVPGFTAPASSKHVQMKSFDTSGNLRWTKNTMNVPFTGSGMSSSASFSYTDMHRHQPVQVQAQFQNGQTTSTKVVDASTVVKARPDLTVSEVNAAAQFNVGQVANIAATIAELNGDLGATATVTLSENGDELDSVTGVNVNASGSVGVIFAVAFDTVGTHDLTVTIGNVNPGDYDLSNNVYNFSIEVVDPMTSVWYDMQYYTQDWIYSNSWSDYYGYGSHDENGWYDYFYENLQIPAGGMTYPIDNVSFTASFDGTPVMNYSLDNITPYYSYNDGCYVQEYSSNEIEPGVWIYTGHYSDCYWGYSYGYAQVYTYSYAYTYYSAGYDYYYGYYNNVNYYAYGRPSRLLTATNNVATTMTLNDDGQSFGGNASMGVSWYDNYYPWNNNWGYGWNMGFQHYWGYQGYSSGMTTAP